MCSNSPPLNRNDPVRANCLNFSNLQASSGLIVNEAGCIDHSDFEEVLPRETKRQDFFNRKDSTGMGLTEPRKEKLS
jgi:hypothetical protein